MKIIAVNINQKLAEGINLHEATKRAWILNINKCQKYSYLIGVAKGEIRSYFKIDDCLTDEKEPPRSKFKLTKCTLDEEKLIHNYINCNNIKLKYFVAKYIN